MAEATSGRVSVKRGEAHCAYTGTVREATPIATKAKANHAP